MSGARKPFIKICGMTTPQAVSASLACEVDAIGFVFAKSVRQVDTRRANELAAPARLRAACVAVTRHPTREQVAEILRDFKPDILQKVWILRKLLYPMDELEAMEFLLDKVKATKSNADFFVSMRRG